VVDHRAVAGTGGMISLAPHSTRRPGEPSCVKSRMRQGCVESSSQLRCPERGYEYNCLSRRRNRDRISTCKLNVRLFTQRGTKGPIIPGVSCCHSARLPNSRHTPRKRGTQYAAAYRVNHRRLWNTGSPAFAGDDSRGWGRVRAQCVDADSIFKQLLIVTTASRSRGLIRPSFAINFRPLQSEGAGNAGRRSTRSRACSGSKHAR
jgi:hypothetical protein